MKHFFLFSIIILSICLNLYGQNIKSNSGVYLTQKNFKENKLNYATPYRLKEKFGFLKSDFDYQAQGTILLKQPNKELLSFEPGKIYSFYSEEKKFLYIPDVKKYLLVLNEKPVTILAGENITYYRFFTHTKLLLFYLNGQRELKLMNDKNLNSDFYNQSKLLTTLKNIKNKFEQIERKQGSEKQNIQEFSKYSNEKLSEYKNL